jgi:CRP/FNR family transcriptional regulator
MPLRVIPRRDRKLNRYVKKGEVRVLGRDETLFRPGDPGDTLFLVRSGHLRLTANHGEPNERTVGVVGPWELTGEEGLFSGIRRRTGAKAGEDTQVTVMEGKGVNRALRTASKTYGAFLLAKEEELALARIHMEPRRAGGTARLLGAVLLHLTRRLGRTDKSGGSIIPIRLTHQVLADLSGCHRSTVTTLLNDWIYQDFLVQEEGQIRILQPQALTAGQLSDDG